MSNTNKLYKGRQHYYLKDGEKEEFKIFERYYPRNPPSWEHVTDPFSTSQCRNCFSNPYVYGMNFLPYFPPPPEMYQSPRECSSDCYSHPEDYGMKFGRTYDHYWRCITPTGCVKKRIEASQGVI